MAYEVIMFRCDRKKCENCSYPQCQHTTDIHHAISFTHVDKVIDGPGSIRYFEERAEPIPQGETKEILMDGNWNDTVTDGGKG